MYEEQKNMIRRHKKDGKVSGFDEGALLFNGLGDMIRKFRNQALWRVQPHGFSLEPDTNFNLGDKWGCIFAIHANGCRDGRWVGFGTLPVEMDGDRRVIRAGIDYHLDYYTGLTDVLIKEEEPHLCTLHYPARLAGAHRTIRCFTDFRVNAKRQAAFALNRGEWQDMMYNCGVVDFIMGEEYSDYSGLPRTGTP